MGSCRCRHRWLQPYPDALLAGLPDQAPGPAARYELREAVELAFVAALLTDDAWLAMPPAPHEYHGAAAIAAFLRASGQWRRGERLVLELVPTRANRQPAFDCFLRAAGEPRPAGLAVLTLTGDRIRGITRFLDPALGGATA
ncbi:MAG TPA: hypothetical protein VIL37_14315 [Natronosporangium sp.]